MMQASAAKKSWAYRRRGMDQEPAPKADLAIVLVDPPDEDYKHITHRNVHAIARDRTQILMASLNIVTCESAPTSALLAWLHFYTRYVR
jgi:hypothetical protein